MKKYVTPSIQIVEICADVLTTSLNTITPELPLGETAEEE